MVKAFNVGPDKTHIAVVTYNTEAKVQFKFDGLYGSQMTEKGYHRLIDQMTYQRGRSYIDKALILADREVFTREAGMRPELPKVCKPPEDKPVSSKNKLRVFIFNNYRK